MGLDVTLGPSLVLGLPAGAASSAPALPSAPTLATLVLTSAPSAVDGLSPEADEVDAFPASLLSLSFSFLISDRESKMCATSSSL